MRCCSFGITEAVYSDTWNVLTSSTCKPQPIDGWVMVSLKHIANIVGKILAALIFAIVIVATPLFAAFDLGHNILCSGKNFEIKQGSGS